MTSFAPTSLVSEIPGTLAADAALAAQRDAGFAVPPADAFSQELDEAAQKRQKARDAADQLVATAFVLPVLQQVRDSPFKSELFSGGRAEQVFGQQLDVILAERITQSAGFGVTEALVRQFQPAAATATQNEVDVRG